MISKKRSIKKLLQGGLIFFDGERQYYIDSFNRSFLFRKDYVEIYWDEIRVIANEDYLQPGSLELLSAEEKQSIAQLAKQHLEAKRTVVVIRQFP